MVVNVTCQVLHNLIFTNGRTKRLIFNSVITDSSVFIILMYVFCMYMEMSQLVKIFENNML